MSKKRYKNYKLSVLLITVILLFGITLMIPAVSASATTSNEITTGEESENGFNLNITSNAGSASLSTTLQILLVLTVISLAPSILIMVTSFTRTVIVFHFTRSALGTTSTPPNQVIIGLAIFLTFFIMAPTFTQIKTTAIDPFTKGEITQEEAFEKGLEPIRNFMFAQTNRKDLKLFLNIAEVDADSLENLEDIPTTTLIPAFIISELRTAFIIGFLIYIPFIVIDMVVASTLMSMGMMMLPPTTISMPFKILLFILADGWNLIVGQVVQTFY